MPTTAIVLLSLIVHRNVQTRTPDEAKSSAVADAEAVCEAVTRPTMRFVPVKSPERFLRWQAHRVVSISEPSSVRSSAAALEVFSRLLLLAG